MKDLIVTIITIIILKSYTFMYFSIQKLTITHTSKFSDRFPGILLVNYAQNKITLRTQDNAQK